jgi:hypothetical protein
MKSIFGKVVVTLFAALYGFSFLMDTGVVPSDRVQTHHEIADKHMDVLLSEGIIDQGEQIEHFYSEGLLSVREAGSILTDRRVIAYTEDEDDELWIYEFAFDEIVSIEQTQEGTTFDYAVYEVIGEGEDNYLELWLPHENGDAARFVGALQAKIGH